MNSATMRFRRFFLAPLAAFFPTLVLAAPPLRDTRPDMFQLSQGVEGGTVAPARQTGPRADRTVGIFYFLWQTGSGDGKTAPYDISKILAADPSNPPWGPRHAFHFWTEPYFGYYAIEDPWILRKHAQMLTDAGVDVVILDATNAFTYQEAYLALCRVYTEMRAQGNRTPQLAFILNSYTGATATKLWNEFYTKKLYPELWFRWRGKPLLLANPAELAPEMRDFFAVRHSWAWSNPKGWFGDGRDKWPWLDNSPQAFGWHDAPDKPEQISVAVAQHPTGNIGRSHQNGKQPAPGQEKPSEGLYFAEQWRRVWDVDPPFVFVTGWNEWIAQRFIAGQDDSPSFLGKPAAPGSSFFVDQYTAEFSRDLEPMRGGLTSSSTGWADAYYYKLVDNVRRYKGVHPIPKASAPRTLSIAKSFTQWSQVGPEFRDDVGDTAHRDFHGWGGYGHYVNTAGRNDITSAKVARDRDNLYFYVRTAKPLTALRQNSASWWMRLLLDTDDAPGGWEGYEYTVRHEVRSGKPVALLYHWAPGGATRKVAGWSLIGRVNARVSGGEMQLSVPRRLLNQPVSRPLHLSFKWVDSISSSDTPEEDGTFLNCGDAAPNARFRYRFAE